MAQDEIRLRNYELSMRDRAPIAAEFEECTQLFQSLCSAFEANPLTWKSYHMLIGEHRDALAAWGAETGATSYLLDHALRKSSSLQQHVIELLQDFSSDLQKSKLTRPATNNSSHGSCRDRDFPCSARVALKYSSQFLTSSG